MALQCVREAAEQAKKELSSLESTHVNLPFLAQNAMGPLHLDVAVTRAEFDNMTREAVRKLLSKKVDKVSEADAAALREAAEQLEHSSAHARDLVRQQA